MQTRSTCIGAAGLAALALAAAGCGGGSAPPVPRANDPVGYAACMRSHGLPHFPDPSRRGQFTFRVTPAMHLDPSSPAFKAAQQTCQKLYPPPAAPTQAQQQSGLRGKLAFAQCMRGHGYPSFPDPGAQGQLTIAMVNAAGIDLHSRAVEDAALACVPAAQGAITAAQVRQAAGGSH